MPVPKRKRSHSRKNKRNANKGVQLKSFTACSNCKETIMPHIACGKCGFYKGAKVIRTKQERSMRRSTDKKAKAERVQAAQQEPVEAEAEKPAE